MDRNKVVLVDEADNPLGEMDKLAAHEQGVLHRAFSVFVFNSKGEMLLQKRAAGKYHGAGLWTNACCSHPQWNEKVMEGARQRLQFEMGLSVPLKEAFRFIYKAPVENNLIENELDHVFTGITDEDPSPNPNEVADWKWIDRHSLAQQVENSPDLFTQWFKLALKRFGEEI